MSTDARPPKPLYANVSPAVKSPCIGTCRLDAERVCLGCHRPVEHIREWRSADDQRRRQIRDQAQARAAAPRSAQA